MILPDSACLRIDVELTEILAQTGKLMACFHAVLGTVRYDFEFIPIFL